MLVPSLVLYAFPFGSLDLAERHLLAIFMAMVLGLVLRPAPPGMIAFLSLMAAILTRALSPERAAAGLGHPTVWLMFSAFVVTQAAERTQLGLRIAYFFIYRLARTSLTLGYAIALTNLALALFVPSDAARGGLLAPLVRSVARVLGSEPGRTANRIGSYLTLVAYQSNHIVSAMFLTSMLGNPLVAKLAREVAHVELNWVRWALAASLPGLATIALLPWLLYQLEPPRLGDTTGAQAFARKQLADMGPVTRAQGKLLVILVGVLIGWITTPLHGFNNTATALAGVAALLLSRVLTWKEVLGKGRTWEVLSWFAPMLVMSEELVRQGVMSKIFSGPFGHFAELPWPVTLAAFTMFYVYAHYAFASPTAHITALYALFLGTAIAFGVPAPLAALLFGFFSSLNAGITHYGVASGPLYFANGFVSQGQWWLVGFVLSVVILALWLGLGPPWWRLLHYW